MTSKDYVPFAALISSEYSGAVTDEARGTVQVMAAGIADLFARDNPRFDRKRFILACKCELEYIEAR